MGLSKKLGVLSQKSSQAAALEVGYKWSNQTYTLHDIIRKFKMPCVVQCATGLGFPGLFRHPIPCPNATREERKLICICSNIWNKKDPCCVLWSDFQFDLRQPLLLYSTRSIQKVHAISVQEDASKHILQEIDPPIAIPRDFEGWFGARPKGIEKFKQHKNIEGVVRSTASRFLVTTKCSAFTSVKSTGDKCQYKGREITPGEVFRKVCVIEDEAANSELVSLIKDYGPCLACLDEKDDDVLIPLVNEAVCYDLAEMYPDNGEQIFRISSLVDCGNAKLPRVLQLVYGDPPVLNYSFTGMLRCYSVFTEETILAAVLDPDKSMCLELATDSAAKFKLALNESVIKKTIEYTSTHHLCDTFGPKFLTGIKVSFSLKPILAGSGEVNPASGESDAHDTNDSDTNDSDTQDISADSEFDVEWRSVSMGIVNQLKYPGNSNENVSENKQRSANQNRNRQSGVDNLDDTYLRQHAIDVTEEDSSLFARKLCYKPEEAEDETGISDDESTDGVQVPSNLGFSKNFGKSENIFSLIHSNLNSTASIDKAGQDSVHALPSDNENPLLYLFQPIKTSSKDSGLRFGPIDAPTKQNEVISPQVGQYVAYKPAREYVDPQSDEDSSEFLQDEEIDSSNNESDLDGNANFTYEKQSKAEENSENVGYSSSKGFDSTNLEKERNLAEISKERDNRFTETILQVEGTNFEDQEEFEQDKNSDSDSEYNIEDILSLAATESQKLSTLSTQDLPIRASESSEQLAEMQSVSSICEKSALLGRKISSESFTSQESFARFNSLIEEVTALVNTSSCRIIGASHRIQKHRNRLHAPKTKNDKGYVELVSSTETIPDSSVTALSSAASITQSKSSVAASNTPAVSFGLRPLIPSSELMVSKPSSLPLLNQRAPSEINNANKFTSNSLDDLTMFSTGVYNSEEANLLPKYNHNGLGLVKRSRGQHNIIDASFNPQYSPEQIEKRKANDSLDQQTNPMIEENINNSLVQQHRYGETRHGDVHYYLQPHSEEDTRESPIYSNIPFVRKNVESGAELLAQSVSLTSVDSDLTSVSSINSVLLSPSGKVSRLSDNVLHTDQPMVDQFWI